MYTYFNPNPKGKEDAMDCAIRAICAAENCTWDEVFKELCKIAFELKELPNSIGVINRYLEKHNWRKHVINLSECNKRPTVAEMVDANRRGYVRGCVICKLAGGLVTIKDGDILDIVDCNSRSVYAYWTWY